MYNSTSFPPLLLGFKTKHQTRNIQDADLPSLLIHSPVCKPTLGGY